MQYVLMIKNEKVRTKKKIEKNPSMRVPQVSFLFLTKIKTKTPKSKLYLSILTKYWMQYK